MSLNRLKERLSKLGEKKSTQPPPQPASQPHPQIQPGATTQPTNTAPAAAAAPAPAWPMVLQIFPQDGLQALVYHHTINTPVSGLIYCWTYVSQGMVNVGQKEVVFTVRRRENSEGEGDFSHDPLRWYEMVYTAAKEGQIVREFQRTDFSSPSFLGRSDLKWIVYASHCPLNNVPQSLLPSEWLQAIPLLPPEAEVAERFGIMRALGHLGASQRWFPWPSWFDRDRTVCITPAQVEGTIRGQVSYAMIQGISAVKKQSDFVLYIPEQAEPGIKEVLDVFQPNNALPLDCVHYKGADSGLLWSNSDTEPRGYAVGNSNSCMNFNFFTFCPDQEQDELKLVEDGCVFLLKTDTYNDIRERVKELQPVSISLESGNTFMVEYGRHGTPESPVNRGETQYKPENPVSEPSKPSHVHCDHLNLLDNNVTNPEDAEPISNYVKAIEQVLEAVIPKEAPPGVEGGGRVAIEADVGGPDRWDVLSRRWITIHFTPPSLQMLPLDEMQEKLTELERPNIETRTRFQVMFHVWGYRGEGEE